MMRNVLVAFAVLFVVACGAYRLPGESQSPSPTTATVSGRAVTIPCSPIEQPGDSACTSRPAANVELDYVSGGSVVQKTATDANGDYSVDLAPGSYTVKVMTYMRVISGPVQLTVSAGSHTVANYVLDSGIRAPAPVPQQ